MSLADWQGRAGAGLVPDWLSQQLTKPRAMYYGLPEPAPEIVTIKVRMVKTTKAIPDAGSPEVVYAAGHDYDLPEWLAKAFFSGGEGDPAEAHQQPMPQESHEEAAPGPSSDQGIGVAPETGNSRRRARQPRAGA